jgi:serine/threonine protein kinase
MLNLTLIQTAFPEIRISRLIADSGQKYVFQGAYGTRSVALKLIKPSGSSLERTQREIDAVSKLNLPYVPNIYSAGARSIDADTYLFLIEEFIQGSTFRALLNQAGRMPVLDTVGLIDELLSACLDFEKARIVHRDLKPDNLMRDASGKLWVIDFGLARHLDLSSLTADGAYGVGTVGYMAPEQFRNLKAEINSRADLYAVGMIAYEALAGSHPYFTVGVHPFDVVRKMESQDAPLLKLPHDTSGMLAAFINFLIQRFPSRRPQSVSDAREYFAPVRKHYLPHA